MKLTRALGALVAVGSIGLVIWAVQLPGPTETASGDNRPCGANRLITAPIVCPEDRASGAQLWSVDGTSFNDVWAVGFRTTVRSVKPHSLILHFDGAEWEPVPTPDVGIIADVSAVSSEEAWAIGRRVLHWNGRDWRTVNVPKTDAMTFKAISATADDDVWVAGLKSTIIVGPHTRGWATFATHWDGSKWSVTLTPNPGTRNNNIEGIQALSRDDVWIGGYAEDGNSRTPRTMTMHWDGSAWNLVPSPSPGNSYNVFWGLGSDSDREPWALGHYGDRGGHSTMLVSRWTGSRWLAVTPPFYRTWSATAASGTSVDDVWVVGSEPTSSLVIAHWDGDSLEAVVAPEAVGKRPRGFLSDVVALAPSDAWAVGSLGFTEQRHIPPLLMHWDGSGWRSVGAPRLGPVTP